MATEQIILGVYILATFGLIARGVWFMYLMGKQIADYKDK